MRRTTTVLAFVAAAAVAGGHRASAATCTVTDARVIVRSFNLDGRLDVAGLALPVEVSEAAGTFRIDFADFPATSFVIVGVDNDVDIEPAAFIGTIDAAGNVSVPAVPIHLTTYFTPDPTPVDVTATLTTGIEPLTVSGRDYVSEGAALDFATGVIHLEGHGIVASAPGTPGAITAGLSITCTLDPIPSQASLPPGPALQKARGSGKTGKPAKDGTLAGDTLKLKLKLAPGEGGFDFAGSDVFFRVPGVSEDQPDGTVEDHSVLVRVPAGTLAAKGKKLVAKDGDGSAIHLVKGRKRDGNAAAAVSGTVVVKQGKRGATVTLKQRGVDLSRLLLGSSEVSVGMGDLVASAAATVVQRKKGISIK